MMVYIFQQWILGSHHQYLITADQTSYLKNLANLWFMFLPEKLTDVTAASPRKPKKKFFNIDSLYVSCYLGRSIHLKLRVWSNKVLFWGDSYDCLLSVICFSGFYQSTLNGNMSLPFLSHISLSSGSCSSSHHCCCHHCFHHRCYRFSSLSSLSFSLSTSSSNSN